MENFYNKMIEVLEKDGRGKVFDEVLKTFNIFNKVNVKKSISLYRSHKPKISLSDAGKEILEYYSSKNVPLYLVTDGNKVVQYNKVKALGIEEKFNKVYITHRFGVKHSKPSPFCFLQISSRQKASNEDIVYIGDNINKDFVGIKPLGYRTIRIKNGMFKKDIRPNEYNAEYTISSLIELKNIVILPKINTQ